MDTPFTVTNKLTTQNVPSLIRKYAADSGLRTSVHDLTVQTGIDRRSSFWSSLPLYADIFLLTGLCPRN